MARILYVEFDDEITELVERIRLSGDDPDLVFVLPNRARVLQSALNLRLLQQYSRSFMKRTSIVSGDPRVQQLARDSGFPVYASVAAHERGVLALPALPEDATRPAGARRHLGGVGSDGGEADDGIPLYTPPDLDGETVALPGGPAPRAPIEGGRSGPAFSLGDAPSGPATATMRGGSASAVAPPPPATAATPRTVPRPQAAAVPAAPPPPPGKRPGSAVPGRRDLYLVAGAVFVIGLVLLFIVAPTAKVTIVLTAKPINVANLLVQGTADPVAASANGRVLTQVVTDDVSSTFTAKPTGTKQIPAAAAKAQIVFTSAYPIPFCLIIGQGTVLAAAGTTKFAAAATPQGSCITRDSTGTSVLGVEVPGGVGGQPGTPSEAIDVVASTTGAAGNVAAGAINQVDPAANGCNPANYPSNPPACSPSDFRVTNAAAAAGGVDAKTQTIVSDQDLASFKSQVDQLTQQAEDKEKQEIPAKTGSSSFVFALDPDKNGLSYSVQVNPPLPTSGAAYQPTAITIAVHAVGVLYDPSTVRQRVTEALTQTASETKAGDSLLDTGRVIKDPVVKQTGLDGQVLFVEAGSGFIGPRVDPSALMDGFAGKGKGSINDLVTR
ncbi:MAG TPA: hypothetical protein VFO60_09945, partial [Candidatus Dormibacteraeota bacterium]|nr:hypothetical protein [Candidatus Dormibacteraeota bacterium]